MAGGVALCFAVLATASSCEVTCCVCCYAVSVVPGADDVVLCLRLLVSSSCGLGWFGSERFCGMVVLRCVLFYLWRAVVCFSLLFYCCGVCFGCLVDFVGFGVILLPLGLVWYLCCISGGSFLDGVSCLF